PIEILARRVPLQFDLVGVMNQPIQNTVGQRGVADLFMPSLNRDLAGEDGGPQLVAIFANFQEIAAFSVRQGSIGPIVDDQHVDLGQTTQEAAQAAIGAGQCQITEQLGCLTKEGGE